ncbi:MAG: hypothetical protein AAF599_00015 [Bacteroidota bacterium]
MPTTTQKQKLVTKQVDFKNAGESKQINLKIYREFRHMKCLSFSASIYLPLANMSRLEINENTGRLDGEIPVNLFSPLEGGKPFEINQTLSTDKEVKLELVDRTPQEGFKPYTIYTTFELHEQEA